MFHFPKLTIEKGKLNDILNLVIGPDTLMDEMPRIEPGKLDECVT